ncbi:hypothetical protein [Halomonas nitroreducens]|uniref:Uncharacterized protein n=1 Tax=Halomonas nitroreducens TaxID=447425 RepID=A0A431V459_9GAMM|nr:hypothetical protein [Halomonas nitroreducens]RTR04993.1 hypothetical protein EKG36_07685 [Halomonas nitroreducens]
MNVLVVSYAPGSDLLLSLSVDRPPHPGEVLHVAGQRVRVLRAIPLVDFHDHAYSVVVTEMPGPAAEAFPLAGESPVTIDEPAVLGAPGGSVSPPS